MQVVTSGARYLDIDGYASAVAYAELLRASGKQALATSSVDLNDSIPPSLKKLNVDFHSHYLASDDDTFSVLDVSDPAYFDPIVDLERVTEVIDHHLGFEGYWATRPGTVTDIEFIGANCTQIYERWQKAGLFDRMSTTVAQLLAAGILDNTLNFQANVTTDRDRMAYKNLAHLAKLESDWPQKYFTACQNSILSHITEAITGDSKILRFNTFPEPVNIGQLVVWDPAGIMPEYASTISDTLSKLKPNWFMNLISLSESKSIFISDDAKTKAWLERLLGVKFTGSLAPATRPWLRKEVVKADISFERSK